MGGGGGGVWLANLLGPPVILALLRACIDKIFTEKRKYSYKRYNLEHL